MKKIFAIVGRPNVGKSTLFNRLTETRDAIVDEVSGVTRDRKYGNVEWCGKEFSVIDTGGFIKDGSDIFEQGIVDQIDMALKECDAAIFVLDALVGLTDLDQQFASLLRRQDKPVIVVSNKVDTSNKEYLTAELYALGFEGDIHSISANNGYGTGELLDKLIEYVPNEANENDGSDIPRISVVGKPNVGKSSLINSLTGEERFIVSDVSGTTRDSADLLYNQFGYNIRLVDTAGLRRAKSINDDLEFYSTLRTRRAIENSDVCILLIDAVEGVTKQDLNIFFEVLKAKKAVVIGVNKWDVLEKSNHSYTEFRRSILEQIKPFTDIEIEFISATSKQRIHKLLDLALEAHENRTRRIPTSKVNDIMLEHIERNPPPAIKGKYVRIKFARQIPTHSPMFAFYCNLPQYVKEPYKRFLENKLRESFKFTGVPIQLFFRKK